MTHCGASVTVVDIRCGVFLLGVVVPTGFAFAGVLILAGEYVGVEYGSLVLDGRVIRRSLAGSALSRYLYSFWYTLGGHGGRGRIFGRLMDCFSLEGVSALIG